MIEETFTFHFRPGDPLETNCAVADVRADRAEIWSSLKSPIWAKEQIAAMPRPAARQGRRPRHRGRRLVRPPPVLRRRVRGGVRSPSSCGKPVKLMWHRTDSFRHGRVHPMAHLARARRPRRRATSLAFDQRHTGVQTDFTQGLGDLITAIGAQPAAGRTSLGFSETLFTLTANVPYNFGARHAAAQRDLRVQHVQHEQRPQRLQPERAHARPS